MSVFGVTLVLSAFLCSLVAGFLFAYAIVIMPGLRSLDDAQFIRAFQVTDRVIQQNSPIFVFVWIGSAVSLIVCAFNGVAELYGAELFLLLLATAGYLAGVQFLTIFAHLPLNNRLQKCVVHSLSDAELSEARSGFEARWNRSNRIRTAIACAVSLLLISLAFRL